MNIADIERVVGFVTRRHAAYFAGGRVIEDVVVRDRMIILPRAVICLIVIAGRSVHFMVFQNGAAEYAKKITGVLSICSCIVSIVAQ